MAIVPWQEFNGHGHGVTHNFQVWSQGHAWFWSVVTGSRMILRCRHRVTAKFRRSQIVTPVAAVNMALMGVTAPWGTTSTITFPLILVMFGCGSAITTGVQSHSHSFRLWLANLRNGRGKEEAASLQGTTWLEPSSPCQRLTEEISKDTKWWDLVSYQK